MRERETEGEGGRETEGEREGRRGEQEYTGNADEEHKDGMKEKQHTGRSAEENSGTGQKGFLQMEWQTDHSSHIVKQVQQLLAPRGIQKRTICCAATCTSAGHVR